MKSDKIGKDSKTMSCDIWLNFKRGMSAILGNYSDPWLENKKFMTVLQTKTATMQRQPKQSIEYNHRITIEWSYYHIMVEQ